ncbi:MAG: (Fe-S)-binding protein, partial [Desulfovibrionaceae bacterium]
LAGAEVLVAEGFRETWIMPRVLLLGDPAQLDEYGGGVALATAGDVSVDGLPHAGSVAELADLFLERGFFLPGLDCGSCEPGDCAGLAREIAAGRMSVDDCKTRQSKVSISVNGRELDLNPFVAGIFHGGLSGMLASLKGFGPGHVDIKLEV